MGFSPYSGITRQGLTNPNLGPDLIKNVRPSSNVKNLLILKSYFQVNKLKFLLLRKDLIRKRYTSAVFNIFPKSLVLLIIISYKKTQKTYWQMSSKTEFPQWSRKHRYHLDISNCCHSRLFLLFQKMFFWGGPFLKSFLNLLQYCFCFMCWVFGH